MVNDIDMTQQCSDYWTTDHKTIVTASIKFDASAYKNCGFRETSHEPTFLGNHGINALVRFLYASKSGLPSYFFSSKGIPDIFVNRKVITIGLTIQYKPFLTERERKKIPHHIKDSPK